MINHLYYNLYKATLKSSLNDIPEIITPCYLGGLISLNLIVLNALLAKFEILPFFFANNIQGGSFAAVLIIFALLYYRKKRVHQILLKYSKESERERIRWNIIVAVYVAMSFLSIFAIGFFRPGKL